MVWSVVHSKVDDFRPMTSSMVILLLGHYLVLPAGLESVPFRSPTSHLPAARSDIEHPAALHLAVAYTSHTETVAVRTVNRTLLQLAPELGSLGITLSPLYTALGDRFSAAVVANLCESWNSSTVLAALVLADHLPGLLPALAAVSAGVPVLWVTGNVRQGYLEPVSMSRLELRMEVGAHEMMRALRSLLLQAHWHTFSLISAVTHPPLPSAALQALRTPPLQPLFRTIRPDASSTVIFRILSEIARATKGVVVLISDGGTAKRIMAEAARLNMVAGNFVWIWIDSDARVTSSQDSTNPTPEPAPATDHVTEPLMRRRKTRESTSKFDRETKKNDRQSKLNRNLRGNRGSKPDPMLLKTNVGESKLDSESGDINDSKPDSESGAQHSSNLDEESRIQELKSDWESNLESKVVKDTVSLIKLELESIVNSVIKKQIETSDKQSDSGDILIDNGVRLRNSGDKIRNNVDKEEKDGVDRLGGKSDNLKGNGDDFRGTGDEFMKNSDNSGNNGDNLRSNGDNSENNSEKLKSDINGVSNVNSQTSQDKEEKKYGELYKNDNLNTEANLQIEMESIIQSVIDEQIKKNVEDSDGNVNKVGYKFDKSNFVDKMEETLSGEGVVMKNISGKGILNNISATPNSLSDNLTDSDNRLGVEVSENVKSDERNVDQNPPKKFDGGIGKPLVGNFNQVSWGIVKILKENEEKLEDSGKGSSEFTSSQATSDEPSLNSPFPSHSETGSNLNKISDVSQDADELISIKTSEVKYFGEVKQQSKEVDEYKEYLCSSSSGVNKEHGQDEICREFRIKKHHQLMKTIKVRDEKSNVRNSRDIDYVHEKGGKMFEFKKSVTSSSAVQHSSDSGDLKLRNSVIDSGRTSSDSEYKIKDGDLFENRTRSRSASSRVRRSARNSSPKNVAKSTIPARSAIPAKSAVPANSGELARELNSGANIQTEAVPLLPVGLLAIKPVPFKIDRHFVRSVVRTVVEALKRAVQSKCEESSSPSQSPFLNDKRFNCWTGARRLRTDFTNVFSRELRQAVDEALAGRSPGTNETVGGNERMAARIQILNLVPEKSSHNTTDQQRKESREWKLVGEIVGHSSVRLDSIVWPGGHLVPASTPKGARSVFRVVTALAPPFVMEGELDEDGQCLRGLECHRLLTSDKDNLTLVFNEMDHRMQDNADPKPKHHLWGISYPRYKYVTSCCYGLAMDLLENVAEELEFDFHLYVVADGMHGSRKAPDKWNGVVGDLISGAAHMSFAALSVNSPRSEVIDFSVPYFFSGVSLLAAPKQRTDIPLLAFLLPFSPELWIAIFTSLNVTAVAVAIYEWLSPFGLNPWGRQRSKNFSMSSAMWVCWGLLCGHLVAFKAPKSWPNKFLINVWGGFSVIFVASYTANIAALIAGLFFHNAVVGDYHDRSLLSQRVATPKASAADYYIHKANQMLWDHVQKYSVTDVAEGVKHLKNGTLDILIADTPILDYYRATDNGCKLHKFGDTINEDTYAVGMTKGFPLKDSISAVMAKYSSNGYMDILQEKWYGGLPCFKLATDMAQPRPLGVAAVAGVFLLLGLGMVVGCLILLAEHLFYRYTLPMLRHKPKGTIWRSRNIMFFSQKLYRFINCVELVSPHHAARELVHTIRQGQITSLFQKSVKRKEHEQRRRRRSKAQFFEMIQEIRRVQQEERVSTMTPPHLSLPSGEGGRSPRSKKLQLARSPQFLSPPDQHRRNSRLPSKLELARRLSRDVFRSKSSGNLRRMSSDISMGRLLDCHSSQAIGRRLSRDTNLSPPDINSRRASSYLSETRLAPSIDIGSNYDITAAPTSPLPLSAAPPDNILTPSGLLPEAAASRFSYIDMKSPSFKHKLSRMHEPAGLSLSLGDRHPTSWSSSFSELNPRVIVCDNNEQPDSGLDDNSLMNTNQHDKLSRQSNWANTSVNSTEHMIQIIIPSEDTTKDTSSSGSSAVTSNVPYQQNIASIKSSPQVSAARDGSSSLTSIKSSPKVVCPPQQNVASGSAKVVPHIKSSPQVSRDGSSAVASVKSSPKVAVPRQQQVDGSIKSLPHQQSSVASIKGSSQVSRDGSSAASIKSSPKVAGLPPSLESSIKSSPQVFADQKMALNLVLNELKERCKEVNAASSTTDAPLRVVSYIPKKPARKSLENSGGAQRSLDDGATAEKRRAVVEQRGKSLDRIGDRNLADKPPPLPAKKERRRVHKMRSSECAEAACGKSQSHAACGESRTRDRRPLVASRSNDDAASDTKRHAVTMATKDVTSPRTTT